jgi:macrolide transport system ATP-binding/permease protein
LQDLRFALRQLRRNPGFACTAVAVLALAIGASAAIFAFVDAALVRPLPYRQPSRLVALFERIPVGDRYHLSDFDYRQWKQRNRAFESLDAWRPDHFTLNSDAGVVEEVQGARVSDGFFQTLGVTPVLGRDFQPGEDRPAAPETVILSYDTWQKRYGGSKDILGKTATLDGHSFEVVGVLPREFSFAPIGHAEVWRTLHGLCEENRDCYPYYGVGRLRSGVTVATARDDLSSIARQIATEFPQSNRDRSATVIPLADSILGDIKPILTALSIGAGLLSLISFVNVASLFLVRTENRRLEIAVREALGASHIRLVRQFATEGFLLASLGWGLGLLFAFCLIRILLARIPLNLQQNMPYLRQVHTGVHAVLFSILLAALGGSLFSMGPALHFLFSALNKGMAENGRTSAGRGWRRLGASLVAVELAVTVVLLVNAGLLTKSFYRLLHIDLGLSPERLAVLHVARSGPGGSGSQSLALERQVIARITSLPGVISAGVSAEPVVGSGEGYSHLFAHFRVAGRPYQGNGDEMFYQAVSTGYFETLQARLMEGRYFTEADDASRPPVAIVNRTMASGEFPGEDPVGKHIINQYDPRHPIEIVGVMDDLKDGSLNMKPTAAVYGSFSQSPFSDFYVTIRTAPSQSEKSMLASFVRAVHAIDPGLLVNEEETIADRINNSQSAYLHRSAASVVAGFAIRALLLGVVGLYGVVPYSVAQRTCEIGVRMALGAQRSSVYRLILCEAAWLAGFCSYKRHGCFLMARNSAPQHTLWRESVGPGYIALGGVRSGCFSALCELHTCASRRFDQSRRSASCRIGAAPDFTETPLHLATERLRCLWQRRSRPRRRRATGSPDQDHSIESCARLPANSNPSLCRKIPPSHSGPERHGRSPAESRASRRCRLSAPLRRGGQSRVSLCASRRPHRAPLHTQPTPAFPAAE